MILVCLVFIITIFNQSLLLLFYCSLPHVNVACRFLQAVVGDDIGFHRVVTVAILSIDQLAHARRARPVHPILVLLLNLLSRVAEDLAILSFLCLLWLGKPLIKHVLIVLNDGCVASELVIESILCVRQNVSLVTHSRSV